MKETGGYFEIEYSNIELGSIHNAALKLNAGRYCLEYIVKARKYSKIYIPYFICDVVLEPLRRTGIETSLYNINESMEPVNLPELNENEAFLYINYFGFKSDYIRELSNKIKNLIVDNCQALFAEPFPGADTFYSLRKFAGVSDGAFLYCDSPYHEALPTYNNSNRVSHLYLRRNINANAGFENFLKSEIQLADAPMSHMSLSSEKFIQTYDFTKNKLTRERNFLLLHTSIGSFNEYKAIYAGSICGPLYYPFLIGIEDLRNEMISNKIYVNIIWPDLDKTLSQDSYENYLAKNLLPLPIDQRYDAEDMKRIINILLKLIKKS